MPLYPAILNSTSVSKNMFNSVSYFSISFQKSYPLLLSDTHRHITDYLVRAVFGQSLAH